MSIKNNTTSLQSLLEVVNALPEVVEQATPVISVNTSGLITATAGTKSSTHQLAFQPAKTITPSTASQIAVSSGYYTGGNITVAAVPTQSKSVTPTSATQNVTPDSGKFLSKVTVNAIPSTYVKPSYTKAATTYIPTTTNQTISAGTHLTGAQTIKGDSNLVAGNIKSGVSIFGVSGTLVEGSGEAAEWSENEDDIIDGSISSYTNDRVKIIRSYAFGHCTSITTVNFPVCTNIDSYAFYRCNSLTTVSFPACTSIEYNAFYSCNSLKSVNFPACTAIGNYAFQYCSSLTSISFPACTIINNATFSNCTSLTSVNFPACHWAGTAAFWNCFNLTAVNLYSCASIWNNTFKNCYNLSSIMLTSKYCCQLAASNAFSSTPYAGYSASFSGTPYIYVPASLITKYQSATNWAYFSSYFSAIEDAN